MENNQIIKPILIKDLGWEYQNKDSKYKSKYAIYLCPGCSREIKAITKNVHSKWNCKDCSSKNNNYGKKHGLSGHPIYAVWRAMKARCYNQNCKAYKDYGERGIKICDSWMNIESFANDMLPGYEKGLSIDRIDNNGNYEPGNCRWTNNNVQSRNTRILQRNNKSGYRGVSWHKRDKYWIVSIGINGKVKQIGYCRSALEGAILYNNYVDDNNLEHTKNII